MTTFPELSQTHEGAAGYHLGRSKVSFERGSRHTADYHVSVAHVRALLAVAEQQRIANLIALAALAGNTAIQGSSFDEAAELASTGLHGLIEYERTPATPFSGPDDHPVLRSEVRKALGL